MPIQWTYSLVIDGYNQQIDPILLKRGDTMKPKKAKIYDYKFEYVEEEYDIYSSEGTEDYVDNDAISSAEEGFMMGYLAA